MKSWFLCLTAHPQPWSSNEGLRGGVEAVEAQETSCTWVVPSGRWVRCMASGTQPPPRGSPHLPRWQTQPGSEEPPSSCSHLYWLTHKGGRSLPGRQVWPSLCGWLLQRHPCL